MAVKVKLLDSNKRPGGTTVTVKESESPDGLTGKTANKIKLKTYLKSHNTILKRTKGPIKQQCETKLNFRLGGISEVISKPECHIVCYGNGTFSRSSRKSGRH